MEGTVLARTDNCPGKCDPVADQMDGKVTYIVRAEKIIRGERPEDGVMYLSTAVNSALCGVELTVGQKYLFNLGDMKTDMESCPRSFWDVGICSFPKAVKGLTLEEADIVQKISTGVVSCKDGKIDAFETKVVGPTLEEAVFTVEPSMEPIEMITVKRRSVEDDMMDASAEPTPEETAENMELL